MRTWTTLTPALRTTPFSSASFGPLPPDPLSPDTSPLPLLEDWVELGPWDRPGPTSPITSLTSRPSRRWTTSTRWGRPTVGDLERAPSKVIKEKDWNCQIVSLSIYISEYVSEIFLGKSLDLFGIKAAKNLSLDKRNLLDACPHAKKVDERGYPLQWL